MGWYKYIGSTVRSVSNGEGNVVAMRPYDTLEIVTVTREVRRMIDRRELVPTAPPENPVKRERVVMAAVEKIQPSPFANWVAFKGKTTDPSIPPTSSGTPMEETLLERRMNQGEKLAPTPEADSLGDGDTEPVDGGVETQQPVDALKRKRR
jgi:hypothetical protein